MVEEATGMAPDMPGHGEFTWSEIATTDLEKAKPFYENVFGWTFNKSENTGDEMEYFEFSSSGDTEPDGGFYQMTPELFGGEMPPAHIALYVAVDDIDASLAKTTELGGTVVFGPYDIPGTGRMGVLADPTGAMISMIQLQAP